MKSLSFVFWYVLSTFSKPMKFLYALLFFTMLGTLIYRILFERRVSDLNWQLLNYEIITALFVLMLPHYFQSLAMIGKHILKIGLRPHPRHVRHVKNGGHGIARKLHR